MASMKPNSDTRQSLLIQPLCWSTMESVFIEKPNRTRRDDERNWRRDAAIVSENIRRDVKRNGRNTSANGRRAKCWSRVVATRLRRQEKTFIGPHDGKRNMRSQRRGRFMLIGWSISRERHEVIDERGENTRRIDKSKLSGSDFVGGSQHLKSFLLDSLSSSAFYWPGRCFMFDDLRFYWSIEALPIRMFVNIRRWYMAEYVNVNFQQ